MGVLVKQTGGLLSDEGFLHKVASWIKTTLLNSTHTLLRYVQHSKCCFDFKLRAIFPNIWEHAQISQFFISTLLILCSGEGSSQNLLFSF